MAGVYLHIPFCKKACHYCDFHFTTSLGYKEELLQSIGHELLLRRDYLQGEAINTIYFGGGTPSLVGASNIQKVIDIIIADFTVTSDAEITLEANPDDLSTSYVKELRQTDINRLSIGVQSFYEEDLIWMNRAHNAGEAENALKLVQDAGFENLTLDLIYGYPLLTNEKWKANLQKVVDLRIPHVSAYSMTVESQTALASFISKGRQKPMDDSQSAEQYLALIKMLSSAGLDHYETSNFALPGSYSKHNTNYWKGVPYLGIGPSAHSFNGTSRQWNVSNNAKYMSAIASGIIPAEIEILTPQDRLNEYLMTSLRTAWGVDLRKIETDFGADYKNLVQSGLEEFVAKRHVVVQHGVAKLTSTGKLFADQITSDLFVA
jgi:oxygen-independent coproporphyrinogen-3 oxidase